MNPIRIPKGYAVSSITLTTWPDTITGDVTTPKLKLDIEEYGGGAFVRIVRAGNFALDAETPAQLADLVQDLITAHDTMTEGRL